MKKCLIIFLLLVLGFANGNVVANTKLHLEQYQSFVDRFRPGSSGAKATVRPTISEAELFDDLVVDLQQEIAQFEQLHQKYFNRLPIKDQKALGPKLQEFFRRYHRGELGKSLDLLSGEPI